MDYITAVRHFGPFGLFDTSSFQVVAQTSRSVVTQTLHRWTKKGWITPIRRGLYALPEDVAVNPITAERAANYIYKDSYVTGLWRMNQLGLIPEGVLEVTSATRNNPAVFETPLGRFAYQHLSAAAFFGYETILEGRVPVRSATAEKALLDFFWWRAGEWTAVEFERWRIQDPFRKIDLVRLETFARRWAQPKLIVAARELSRYLTTRYGP